MTVGRRLILQSGFSLDGFIEGPDHDISWHRVDDELHWHMNEQLSGMGAFLSGRVTWELMADFWPTADQDPEAPPVMVDFANIWREMPKIVYSKTLREAGWDTPVVRDVGPSEVHALREQRGCDLLLCGSNVAVSFMAHDLIDEYR